MPRRYNNGNYNEPNNNLRESRRSIRLNPYNRNNRNYNNGTRAQAMKTHRKKTLNMLRNRKKNFLNEKNVENRNSNNNKNSNKNRNSFKREFNNFMVGP